MFAMYNTERVRLTADITQMPKLLEIEANFKVELPRTLGEYREEDLRNIGLSTIDQVGAEYWVARSVSNGACYRVMMERAVRPNHFMRLHIFMYTDNKDVEYLLSLVEHKRRHQGEFRTEMKS